MMTTQRALASQAEHTILTPETATTTAAAAAAATKIITTTASETAAIDCSSNIARSASSLSNKNIHLRENETGEEPLPPESMATIRKKNRSSRILGFFSRLNKRQRRILITVLVFVILMILYPRPQVLLYQIQTLLNPSLASIADMPDQRKGVKRCQSHMKDLHAPDAPAPESIPRKKGSRIAIIVISGTARTKGRRLQRQNCFPMYEAAGLSHIFAIGVPSFDTKNPHDHLYGQLATPEEQCWNTAMIQEHEKYKDILFTPSRDIYRDLTDKMLSVYQYYLSLNADYIVKVDDEYCVNLPMLNQMIIEHEAKIPKRELYFGYYRYTGYEYKVQLGPHGETAPYMKGSLYGLSREIVRTIIEDDWVHTLLKGNYGNTCEDGNMGKWIKYAKQVHNVTVDFDARKGLNIPVEKVSPDMLIEARRAF